MENKITLFGASGHCKVIIDILQNCNIAIGVIIDDNPNVKSILEKSVLLSNKIDTGTLKNVIVAIGNNRIRKLIVSRLEDTFSKAIHPRSTVSPYVKIDVGTVVMAGVIINPDVEIGKHCILNTAAVIEHDCIIEDFVHISPNVSLAGGVHVGEGTHIGISATVIQEIKIGKWVTIGAGTVIINDIPDYAVVVGNPGKIIKYNIKHE
jgi:sugar O-acyltransferase (sialic acid O-acetyltransferase NeuD family)